MPNSNPKDRTIKLIVQAQELFNSEDSNNDMDKYTSLVDDTGFGNAFGEPNKDFETIVYMNKRICWTIEMDSTEGENQYYSVALSKVIHKPDAGNPNFFTSDPLNVNRGTGKVCGTIARNPNLPNKDDSYSIEFSIGFSKTTPNGGMQTGMLLLTLDPKLKISVRQ
jgi:hypothetical protein